MPRVHHHRHIRAERPFIPGNEKPPSLAGLAVQCDIHPTIYDTRKVANMGDCTSTAPVCKTQFDEIPLPPTGGAKCPAWLPNPDEIAEVAREIRATWSHKEHRKRQRGRSMASVLRDSLRALANPLPERVPTPEKPTKPKPERKLCDKLRMRNAKRRAREFPAQEPVTTPVVVASVPVAVAPKPKPKRSRRRVAARAPRPVPTPVVAEPRPIIVFATRTQRPERTERAEFKAVIERARRKVQERLARKAAAIAFFQGRQEVQP